MQVAVSTLITFRKEHSSLPETIMANLSIVNWEVIDEGFHKLNTANIKALKEIASTGEVRYSIHAPFSSINLAEPDSALRNMFVRFMEKSLKRAYELEARIWVLHPGRLTPFTYSFPEKAWEANNNSLLMLSKEAKDLGIQIVVENMPGRYELFSNLKNGRKLLEDVMMLDVLLAILAGFLLALGVVLVRKGLLSSNLFSSSIVTVLVGNIVLWPILLFFAPKSSFNLYGLIVFVLAGLLHPALSRLIYSLSMLRIGVSVNCAIYAISPLFSAFFAILLLNEQPTLFLWIGIGFVVVGSMVIQGSIQNSDGASRIGKRNLLIPVGGCLIYSLSNVLRKIGLNAYSEPLLGVAISYLAALVFYGFVFTISPKMRSTAQVNSQTFKLFWKGGLCMTVGWVLVFYAFQYGSVAVVTPLIHTDPLFILILAYLYLRSVEKPSWKVVLGTLTIVGGIMLITIFKG